MKKLFIKIYSVILLILVAISGLLWTQFESYDLLKDTDKTSVKIEHLDEVLTMSSRMAAFTGDDYWIARYNNHVDILDKLLKDVQSDPNILNEIRIISDANNALVAIERQAIQLVRNQDLKEAQDLLFDATYQRHKNDYTEGIKSIAQYINQRGNQSTEQISVNFRYSFITIIFMFIITSLFGIYIINTLNSYNNALECMTHELDQLAKTDVLTELLNRRCCDESLNESISMFKRFKQGFCVILVDIDFFKSINDNFGHDAGDDVLKEFAKLLSSSVREVDKVFRWGGEEFIILMPHTDIENGSALAERLRIKIENHNFHSNNPLTASFGVTEYQGDLTKHLFIEQADKALYKAKQRGRNQVVTFTGAQ